MQANPKLKFLNCEYFIFLLIPYINFYDYFQILIFFLPKRVRFPIGNDFQQENFNLLPLENIKPYMVPVVQCNCKSIIQDCE